MTSWNYDYKYHYEIVITIVKLWLLVSLWNCDYYCDHYHHNEILIAIIIMKSWLSASWWLWILGRRIVMIVNSLMITRIAMIKGSWWYYGEHMNYEKKHTDLRGMRIVEFMMIKTIILIIRIIMIVDFIMILIINEDCGGFWVSWWSWWWWYIYNGGVYLCMYVTKVIIFKWPPVGFLMMTIYI